MTLKSIGVLSCGKMLGVIYAALGLLVGALMALFAFIGALAEVQQDGQGAALPVALGMAVAMLLFIPVAYGVMGFIGGVIVAAIYNVAAGFIGGLEFEFEPR